MHCGIKGCQNILSDGLIRETWKSWWRNSIPSSGLLRHILYCAVSASSLKVTTQQFLFTMKWCYSLMLCVLPKTERKSLLWHCDPACVQTNNCCLQAIKEKPTWYLNTMHCSVFLKWKYATSIFCVNKVRTHPSPHTSILYIHTQAPIFWIDKTKKV